MLRAQNHPHAGDLAVCGWGFCAVCRGADFCSVDGILAGTGGSGGRDGDPAGMGGGITSGACLGRGEKSPRNRDGRRFDPRRAGLGAVPRTDFGADRPYPGTLAQRGRPGPGGRISQSARNAEESRGVQPADLVAFAGHRLPVSGSGGGDTGSWCRAGGLAGPDRRGPACAHAPGYLRRAGKRSRGGWVDRRDALRVPRRGRGGPPGGFPEDRNVAPVCGQWPKPRRGGGFAVVDTGPDRGGSVALGLADPASGFSLLFGDRYGGQCPEGFCDDFGALFGMDSGPADGSGELAGGGPVGSALVGPGSDFGPRFSALLPRGRGLDGIQRTVADETDRNRAT